MNDATIQSIVNQTPAILAALGTFFNLWISSRVHKAVNSTATVLATVAKEKEEKIIKLETENASLKETVKSKDTVAAVIAGQVAAQNTAAGMVKSVTENGGHK